MNEQHRPARTAGIFDIRNIIGTLIGLYGAVLLVTGLVGTSAEEVDRSAGVNANLWSGIVMLVVGAFFVAWAKLRPTVVDDVEEDHGQASGEVSGDASGDGSGVRRPGGPQDR